MSKILIPSTALERILLRIRGMMADLKRPPSDKERALVEWLEKMTDAGDGDDMDALARKIGHLRNGWDRAMTAMEMHTLHGSSECLNDFSKDEWELMREYLHYTPRAGEKFWQVRSREKFLQAPVDTLTAAEDWARTHRRKASPVKPPEAREPQRGEFSMDEFREMFGFLRPGEIPSQTPKPIPEPSEVRSQASLLD